MLSVVNRLVVGTVTVLCKGNASDCLNSVMIRKVIRENTLPRSIDSHSIAFARTAVVWSWLNRDQRAKMAVGVRYEFRGSCEGRLRHLGRCETLRSLPAPHRWGSRHFQHREHMNVTVLSPDSTRARFCGLVSLAGGQVVETGDEAQAQITLVSGDLPSCRQVVPELVQQGKTVWLVPEAGLGSDFIYAQIPLDDEFPNQLRAIWPLRLCPAVVELKRKLAELSLGPVLHLQMERSNAGGPTFDPEQAHIAWLQDADLLRSLAGGDYKRVTAIHSGHSAQGITTASVSLNGDNVPDAMWSYRAGGTPRTELTVTTDRGAAVLLWVGDGAPTLTINCQLVGLPASTDSLRPEVHSSPIALAGGRTEGQAEGPDLGQSSDERVSLPPGVTSWGEAVRAFDLLDAARRSLTRKRTVELQFESTSERSQFKTHMTAVGCSLLLLTMFGLIGLLFAGRMLDPRDTQQKQSETAGFVLTAADFDGTQLNSYGREKMVEIVDNFQRRSATVLIDGQPDAAESLQRRATVVQELGNAQLPGAEVRTLIRPLQGVWFKRGMLLAWIVLFLPLGIMLAIQVLIGVTPGSDATSRRTAVSSDRE